MMSCLSPRNVARILGLVLSIAAGFTAYTIWQIKADVDRATVRLTLDPGPASTLIYDSKDQPLSALYREHRLPVALEEMADDLVRAVLVTEDRHFYEHDGLDRPRILASMIKNLREGRITQGASTITQQFARAAVQDRSRTYGRKLREVWLAHRLEAKYSKQAILQAYLNHVYFGDGYHGVEAAARGYFAKPASRLNAAESATLAALISRPSGFGLRRTPGRVRDRRDWVLRQMLAERQIDATAFGAAIATPMTTMLATPAQRAAIDPTSVTPGPYFVSLVTEQLYHQFGIEKTLAGGLRVYTTLDTNVQRFAEDAVMKRLKEIDKKHKAGEPLQAALVAMEPATGYVRALVGGRNFAESSYNRATSAKRQPGSAFKPFVFAAALEAGFSPGTIIEGLDESVDSAQGAYLPGGEHELQSTTLRSALVHSSNRAAVHLMQRVGLRPTVDLATRVGLSEMPAVPSLALGTGEVSLLDLTSAYTAFANAGVLQPPVIIRRIEDADGHVLFRANEQGRRVFSESTAFLMASMLSDVISHGTGYHARQNGFSLPAGGKTGSTDDHADAWFVGFTPRLAAGVWMGYDRPQPIMRRGFASVVAVPAWAGFMKAATTGNRAEWMTAPVGISRIRRCKESGGLATEYCELAGEVYDDLVAIGRAPDLCPLHAAPGTAVPPPN